MAKFRNMSEVGYHIPVVLLAFANDEGQTLRKLDDEHQDVLKCLEKAQRQGHCKVVSRPAATARDIIEVFQEYRDQVRILHYGGHSDADDIFLKSSYQNQPAVQAQDLADFLSHQAGLELLFLNSCLSVPQALAYQRANVKAVLATDQAIGDGAARLFARLFYQSLASGKLVAEAFQEAVSTFRLENQGVYRGILTALRERNGQALPWQLLPENPGRWGLQYDLDRLRARMDALFRQGKTTETLILMNNYCSLFGMMLEKQEVEVMLNRISRYQEHLEKGIITYDKFDGFVNLLARQVAMLKEKLLQKSTAEEGVPELI